MASHHRKSAGSSQRSLASVATVPHTNPGQKSKRKEDGAGIKDPRLLLDEENQHTATIFHLPFSKGKWRGGTSDGVASWCKLFQGTSFEGNLVAPTTMEPQQDEETSNESPISALTIPSMELRDIVDRNEEDRTGQQQQEEDTTTNNNTLLLSRSVRTKEIRPLQQFLTYRTLQIGRRYYLCKDSGPMGAFKAFEAIINQKKHNKEGKKSKKELLWELLMPLDSLFQFYEAFMKVNEAGGYATFSVAKATDKWFALQDIVMIGPPAMSLSDDGVEGEEIFPLQMHVSAMEQEDKGHRTGTHDNCTNNHHVVGANEDGDMFGTYEAKDITVTDVTLTKPVPWGDTSALPTPEKYGDEETNGMFFSVPVHSKGYVVDLDEGLVRKVDVTHVERVPCPLSGWIYQLSRPRKSGCCSISRVGTNVQPQLTKEVEWSSSQSPLVLLGGSVVIHEQHQGAASAMSYVRLLSSFFDEWNDAMEESDLMRVHVKETGKEHKAGLKGTHKIFQLDPVVKIAGEWYWLSSLKKARIIPRFALSEEKHRYLSMSITE
uniref:Uncharacterized protein n=1 Tax=Grammatophora oceanica TaxID=210454 RepID=A0A7S1V1X0_9STRA|mmetsp:Transcript_34527/g.51240  ORF Transcript_34527/g.51240 Transcript_34527/m.51240 type:complete len:546 (+) Transcript_34527:164-1801(+)